MLRGTIRKDDFQRNTALQCWNNVATIRNNVATMLQRCVVLKIVVTNRLVQHHLQRQNCKSFTTPLSRNAHMRLEHKESQTKYRNTTGKPRSHISNVGYSLFPLRTVSPRGNRYIFHARPRSPLAGLSMTKWRDLMYSIVLYALIDSNDVNHGFT